MALLEASRRLQATFQAAFDFGLTDEEVWEVILEVTSAFRTRHLSMSR